MNELINMNNIQLMSSREIAELCDKDHKNVLADIRNVIQEMNDELQIQPVEYRDLKGELRPAFNLDKEASLVVVSGYSIKLRTKIIKRWQELENQQKPILPQTYLEALEKLVETEKEKQRLLSINNALMHTMKTFTTSEIAKELNIKSAKQLNKILHEKGIQYKLNGTWLLYAQYANMGMVEIKQGQNPNGHIYYDTKWNNKGREFILALFKKV